MIKVPYNYLPSQFENNEVIFDDWRRLIETTEFTIGPYVERFEEKFADFLSVKHCISTNTGTDALVLALKSLGIGFGDEVITVTNSFYATVGAIVAVGATPVFVDSDDRFQIDVEGISGAVTKKTKAVIPVHWGGASPDLSNIEEICHAENLLLIEDACMGIGAAINGRRAGTFGVVNAFSMHPLKSLNVMGDGGMVVTNNDDLAIWMKKYRNHGMQDRDHIEFWGLNMRLQPLQAVVAFHGLDDMESIVERRNYNAKVLDHGLAQLKDNVVLPQRRNGFVETFALYMGLFDERDKLRIFLNKRGVETRIHYPIPLHLQPAAVNLGHKKGDFPVSEWQSGKLLTIPAHQFLNKAQLEYTIEVIRDFYG